jgi:hypothetical protein
MSNFSCNAALLFCLSATVTSASAQTVSWSDGYPGGTEYGTTSVKLDSSGNTVVVAPEVATGTPTMFRTTKYDSAGVKLWTKSFAGYPSGLAIGSAGEVIVAGLVQPVPYGSFFLALAKYDSGGVEQWTRTYQLGGNTGPDVGSEAPVAIDGAGNAYVAARFKGMDSRVGVIKYAPDGTVLWAKTSTYYVSDSTPWGPFLALSPNGNVIVGGSGQVSGPPPQAPSQFVVWALDAAGTTAWNAVGDFADVAGGNVGAMAVDALNNVVVGDFISGRIVKVNPSGVRLWSTAPAERVVALAVDPTGDIAVATGVGYALRIAKYSSTGALLWSRSDENAQIRASTAALRSGADGTVFAVGDYTDLEVGTAKAPFVAAYNSLDGHIKWSVSEGPSISYQAVDVGATGRIVVAGYGVADGSGGVVRGVESLTDDPVHPLLFHTVSPCRVTDSRDPNPNAPPRVLANSIVPVGVASLCGIPLTARAVALNVTTVGGTSPGYVSLYPWGSIPPSTSTTNHSTVGARATQSVVGLGRFGWLGLRAIQASGGVNVILDVSGYFE